MRTGHGVVLCLERPWEEEWDPAYKKSPPPPTHTHTHTHTHLSLSPSHTLRLAYPFFPYLNLFYILRLDFLQIPPFPTQLIISSLPHSLLFFHAFTSSCLCDAFVSRICQSPSHGMLLAASFRLLLWNSHAGSLWVGLSEQGSQPRK